MRMFNRRNVFNLFWTAVFFGPATVLILAGARLALADTPVASSESPASVPSHLYSLLSPLSPFSGSAGFSRRLVRRVPADGSGGGCPGA